MHRINGLLVLFFSLVVSIPVITQEMHDLHPCGTNMGRSVWLKRFQAEPHAFPQRGNETLYVPVTVHIVGTDNGGNYYREQNLVLAFCTLNRDFGPSGIQFYLAGPIRYINSTEYATHNNIPKGAEMMFKYNVPNTMNTYFVGNASGFCGYNLPYAGIVISQNCARPDDHTWAHEAGHHFAIPHPFLGWEGGVSWNNTVPHNYADPAPEKVLYDYTLFKDVYYSDTLIIDTAFVEKTDGSNCHFAADGFCDTQPDYLYNRWQCNSDKRSQTTQTDPSGVKFTSDASLIMSYALDNCSAFFTSQQMAAMRAYLIDRRSNYLSSYLPPQPPGTQQIQYLTPVASEIVFQNNVLLEWSPVENAEAYLIQIATSQNFGIILEDTIVYQSNAIFASLRTNSNLFWRVKPLNSANFCGNFSGSSNFRTSNVSHTTETTSGLNISFSPNPVGKSDVLFIQNPSASPVHVIIRDLMGNVVKNFSVESEYQTIHTDFGSSGIYFIESLQNGKRSVSKIVVRN